MMHKCVRCGDKEKVKDKLCYECRRVIRIFTRPEKETPKPINLENFKHAYIYKDKQALKRYINPDIPISNTWLQRKFKMTWQEADKVLEDLNRSSCYNDIKG